MTGLVGALELSGKYVFVILRIPTIACSWMARGFTLGTTARGIGSARVLQVNPDPGAFAGLALGVTVALDSLLIPLHFRLLG